MKAVYHYEYMDSFHVKDFMQIGEKDFFRDKEPSAFEVKNGVVLPYRKTSDMTQAAGGILDVQAQFVEASAQHIVGEDIVRGYEPDTIEDSDKHVIYFGAFHAHWGHFLTEMVTRCWYFCGQIDWEVWHVVYIRKNDTCSRPMEGTYREFLELLGVPAHRIIQVEKPTRFAAVMVPEISNDPGHWFTNAYVRIFDRIRDAVGAGLGGYEKVYYTRQKAKGLRDTQIGERGICKLFKHNGYRIVAPEQLSLREQVLILKQCKQMVVVEGTLMHNVLFAESGIHLIIINRVCGANSYQPFINQARMADVTYVDAHLSFFPVFAGGPFLLYRSESLLRYAGDNGFRGSGRQENTFCLHGKLIWYFLRYLDQMTADCIVRWNLREKHGDTVLEQYRFYRDRIKNYDIPLWRKMRKVFYMLIRCIADHGR